MDKLQFAYSEGLGVDDAVIKRLHFYIAIEITSKQHTFC